uniref:Uncharacterized protein n=1 Tax=Macrostomum lignano TaxID=282301 RepID=A0A1I8FFV8_9PLAT
MRTVGATDGPRRWRGSGRIGGPNSNREIGSSVKAKRLQDQLVSLVRRRSRMCSIGTNLSEHRVGPRLKLGSGAPPQNRRWTSWWCQRRLSMRRRARWRPAAQPTCWQEGAARKVAKFLEAAKSRNKKLQQPSPVRERRGPLGHGRRVVSFNRATFADLQLLRARARPTRLPW